MLNDSIQSSVVAAWGGGGGGVAVRFLSLSERECPSLRSTRNIVSLLTCFYSLLFFVLFFNSTDVGLSSDREIFKTSRRAASSELNCDHCWEFKGSGFPVIPP